MIVRKEPNGTLLLVPQTEHSKLVGQFAAHWGNARFATPQPYESIARAATFHDFGWLRYETEPEFDPRSGETPGFRDAHTDATRLDEYRWCIDWFLAHDAYASHLVSMHRTGLWRGRYDAIAQPPARLRPLEPHIEAFIAEFETRRARELAEHGWDPLALRTNYRLLQVWDLLGLYLGCQEPYPDAIAPVPVSFGDAEADGVTLTLTPAEHRRVIVDPFPFDVQPLVVQMAAKRLPEQHYETQDAFRTAYFKSSLELMQFELA